MKPYLKVKYALLLLLILLINSTQAQVMLPAYQGVFSKKILSSSGVASNGLDFGEVDEKNIINQKKLKGGKKEGLLKY